MIPAFRLMINGNDAPAALSSRISSFVVTDNPGGHADSLELEVDAHGALEPPPIGAEIKAWLGYEPKLAYMGSFRVTSWDYQAPPAIIRVSAASADLTGDIRMPRSRSYHETTVGAIVEQVASRHGLAAAIDAKIGAREIPHIDQQNESDAAFLTRLARRQGATFKVADGRILFSHRGGMVLANGEPKLPVLIRPKDCSDWSFTRNSRGDYTAASAPYIDRPTGKRKRAKAGTGTAEYRDRRLYGSKAEAEAAAGATLAELIASGRSGSINGAGNPLLYADARITLKGFLPVIDGNFTAKKVVHTYNSSGYVTSADLESVTESNG